MIEHTKGPFSLYTKVEDLKSQVAEPVGGGEPFVFCNVWLMAGDKIIGNMNMNTAKGGLPNVRTMAEFKANCEFVVAALNAAEFEEAKDD